MEVSINNMVHVVKEITALDDFILEVEFESGEIKHYDVKQLFDKYPIFDSLKNERSLFTQVKVDGGGFGVSWNDKLDISSEELWKRSITV